MRIFVTGGTGFIGSYFVRRAFEAGHELVAHRRSESSSSVIDLSEEPSWVTGAMSEIDVGEFDGCDALVHLAAHGVTPQPAGWSDCFAFNVDEGLGLVERAHAAGVKRVVVAGSYAEYGRSGLRYEKIPTDAPLEPTDPYAASKAASSIAVAAYARQSRLELYYGRIFSAFGLGQNENNFWPQLKKAAESGEDFPMTPGGQVRDFIPVEEVAAKFLYACTDQKIEAGEPVFENVASGVPVTLAGFAEIWWERFGATGELKIGELPYREGEVMTYIPDV